MKKFHTSSFNGFRAFSPIARVYDLVKEREERNRNLLEMKQLSRFIQEDIGLLP